MKVTGLPANLDAERFILGTILLEPSTFPQVASVLESSDFSLEANRRIFLRMMDLVNSDLQIDRVTLAEELMQQGQLESVGGLSYLISLDEGLPQVFNLEGYLRIVIEKSNQRKLIHSAQFLMDRASQDLPDENELSKWAEQALFDLKKFDQKDRNLIRVDDYISSDTENFYDPAKNDKRGVWLPWKSTKPLIRSLLPGQLVILAARPAVGKSSAAFQIAYEASKRFIPVAAFSLEMPKRDIIGRICCGEARVDVYLWRNGLLDAEGQSAFRRASADFEGLPFFIDDNSGCTVPAILAAVKRMPVKPQLIVIDYLQLLSGSSRSDSRNHEVSQISRALKRAALEMDVTILALSQLSRDSAKEKRAPELSDLRDSGSIEQDADVVIFLHAPGEVKAGDPETEVKFLVKKNRNGSIGGVNLTFERPYTKFREQL